LGGEETMAYRANALSALLLLAMASTASAQAPQASGQLPTGPLYGDQDLSPFYRWTQALPAKPGGLLREEGAPKNPEITLAAKAQRIPYTSTHVLWHPGLVPVSGTLSLPKGTPPQGGWPLISWVHGTLGVADRCAPS